MEKRIQTERLVLRPLESGDVDWLLRLDSDPEVMRYITDGHPSTRETIEQDLLPRMMNVYPGKPGIGFWAVELEDEPIGWVHLRPDEIDDAEDRSLGYRLMRRHWTMAVCILRRDPALGHVAGGAVDAFAARSRFGAGALRVIGARRGASHFRARADRDS